MPANEPKVYQNFNSSYLSDINGYISGVVSIVFNILLMYATLRTKSYTQAVRFSLIFISILRLIFSVSIILTVPTLLYSKNITTLYILKNGYSFPIPLGNACLTIFVTFIVLSCNLPAVQYLQVACLQCSSSRRKEMGNILSVIPVALVIISLVLIFSGYMPPSYNIHISSLIKEKLEEEGPTAFLMVTVTLTFDPSSDEHLFHLLSQICTLFILIVMFISIVIVIICFFYIKKKMKTRFFSSKSRRAQEQLNLVLALQFVLPLATVHIPFYIIVILPFFGVAVRVLSDQVLWLFSWCPAINPILVFLLVKNVREQLIPPSMKCLGQSRKTSKIVQVQSSPRVRVGE